MQVQIKFIVGGASSSVGGFSAGDTLRCHAEMAKHLVEDAKCAEYVVAEVAAKKVETKQTKAK